MMLVGWKQMWCFIGQTTRPKERSGVCPCLQAQLGATGLVLSKPRQPPREFLTAGDSCWGVQDGYPGPQGPSVTPRVPNTTLPPHPCALPNSRHHPLLSAEVGQALTLENGISPKGREQRPMCP